MNFKMSQFTGIFTFQGGRNCNRRDNLVGLTRVIFVYCILAHKASSTDGFAQTLHGYSLSAKNAARVRLGKSFIKD